MCAAANLVPIAATQISVAEGDSSFHAQRGLLASAVANADKACPFPRKRPIGLFWSSLRSGKASQVAWLEFWCLVDSNFSLACNALNQAYAETVLRPL